MQERKPGCICELDPKTGEPVDAHYGECIVHRPDAPSPKREAEIFVNKFVGKLSCWNVPGTMSMNLAKSCAGEMTTEILNVLDSFKNHEYGKVLIPFYQNVQREIELL